MPSRFPTGIDAADHASRCVAQEYGLRKAGDGAVSDDYSAPAVSPDSGERFFERVTLAGDGVPVQVDRNSICPDDEALRLAGQVRIKLDALRDHVAALNVIPQGGTRRKGKAERDCRNQHGQPRGPRSCIEGPFLRRRLLRTDLDRLLRGARARNGVNRPTLQPRPPVIPLYTPDSALRSGDGIEPSRSGAATPCRF